MTASVCWGLHLYRSCYCGIKFEGVVNFVEAGRVSLDDFVCTSHGPTGSARSALG